MARDKLSVLVCAVVVCGLLSQACWAGPMQLTLYMNLEARKFLISTNQRVVIIRPDPLSNDGKSVIAALVLQPIADATTLTVDTDSALYVANGPVTALSVITIASSCPVSYGNAYSFDGTEFNGEGSGWGGHVSVEYDAPANAQPILTGLAGFIYESGTDKPSAPSPTNYYTLNLFETRYIDAPAAVVWVLVASDIKTGSVLPIEILKPVSRTSVNSKAMLKQSTSVQTSRYLAVPLSTSSVAAVHFDTSINAFVDGAYEQ
ncbi:hypothetical protein [Pseudomonas fontis]|uniref:Lipoprotein n=1 Tax=Pseudomonas fontis TaxID=2942633 RepID=A0ABT5P172_9PSED|nr:hypothetical protein [Pseudomonas fontis]MDD0975489.1 hypothetical protein [Pseudomonas fontis]MDD0994208.1 hypothetical protein [Pseudomonas fontis]